MSLRIALLFLVFIATFGRAQNRIDSVMNELLQADFLCTSEVGISVFDLTADSVLYSYQAEKRYHPASAEKLLTCICAIDLLEADYPIRTTLCHDGRRDEGILHGDLYVVGGFDSEFGEEDMTQFVQLLSAQGIHTLRGKIYGDLSMKDTLPYGTGWCWDDALYDYQPVLSPLTCHKGYLTIRATPTRRGQAAQIEVTPAFGPYHIDNRTLTNEPQAGPFSVTRDLFSTSRLITVSGNVTKERTSTLTVPRPQDLFMAGFLQCLEENEIQHAGFAGYRECPVEGSETIGYLQRPLQELVRRALKRSDNLSAEAIFYQMASYTKGERYASASDAIRAINALMLEIGMDADDYDVADGSGLSRYNYISPEVLIGFLRYAAHRPSIMEVLYPSLPVAGVDGTLRNRMKNGLAYKNVRAKTGTLTGASSLAGYLTASNGHLIAFAILHQNIKNGKDARAFQDRLCELLCQ